MNGKIVPAFAIWIFLVGILLATLVINWQKIDDEASDTTFLMLENQITERANAFRQQWVISKKPSVIEYEGEKIQLDGNGWVLPLLDNKVNCKWWLETLYPRLGNTYLADPEITMISGYPTYHCQYEFKQKKVLDLVLSEKTLSISTIK
ncbi:hypothetical protein HC752_18715 [Vibrio sp. S9_S30]|uniref:hypothetical protein n=1 Tax=Vibrio sp. S9_S30 TaxID=2720226 RepID=UPI00168068AC|nr:hypothetical protein [Vibrio sp. S9_S30]MBD1558972.1 hypothetical protein [Vibrio sp. S9_S30]